MKEFEKWFRKNKPYEIYSCMDMAEKAWKVVLEWLLSHDTGPCSFRRCEIRELIEKELKSD